MVDTNPYDTENGTSGISFVVWPMQLPPRTSQLIIFINHGHPHMAKALIEAGADNRPGGSSIVMSSGKQLEPIHWLLNQMPKKQWKQVLGMILDIDATACPEPGKRQYSVLAQSIRRQIPLDVTSMLIKRGNLNKKHMLGSYQYELNVKKMMSPSSLAKQERDQDDPSSTGGCGRARLAMIRKVV